MSTSFGQQPVNVNCNKCRATVTTMTDSETASSGKIIACKYHLIKTGKSKFSCRAILVRQPSSKTPWKSKIWQWNSYCKVASSNTSRLEAHAGFFRLLMKGIFDPYVLWPFDKKLISLLVMRIRTRNYTAGVFDSIKDLWLFSMILVKGDSD